MSVFTEDSKTRKEYPAYSGFIAYFPDAIREVANYVPTAEDSYLELYSDAVVRCDWIAAAFYSLKVLEHSEGDPECGGMADGFHGSIHQLLTKVPRSVAAICKLSKEGNDKHNPGQPLHWSRDKSSDHKDCMVRHLIDGDWTELAWRSLANLQVELEGNKKPEEYLTPVVQQVPDVVIGGSKQCPKCFKVIAKEFGICPCGHNFL